MSDVSGSSVGGSSVGGSSVAPVNRRSSELSAGALLAMAVGLAGLVVAIVALFLPVRSTTTVTAVAPSGAESAAGIGKRATPKLLEVSLAELFIKPNRLSVNAGDDVSMTVHNKGTLTHDMTFSNGRKTRMLKPGESETVALGVVKSPLTAFCTVPGHKDGGMTFALDVVGAASPAAAAAVATPTADTMMAGSSMAGQAAAAPAVAAAAAEPADATIDFAAAPPKDWKPRDPVLQPPPAGTVHELTLHATEKMVEVSPGVKQEMWTFNDTVPGPVLHGRIGDTFKVTLVNDGKVGHSIDFHASRVAWNDKMRTINTGESLVYEFKADYAGIFMYHCGTAPALHHIGNGMYGAIIIDPPDLQPVAHEYVIVQSELYLGPQGQPGSLAKMKNEAFDAVVFNGYVNGYKNVPIRVEPNERVRAWVLDAGPSENSAFHIVGTIFDTVWKEGTYVLRPDARRGGSQVMDLQPAQGGFVEFSFAEAGLYPIVTHKFSNVGKGALGLFQAGDVAAVAAGH